MKGTGALISAEVVASFGRQFLVEAAGGEIWQCVTRGKRTELACGDSVHIAPTAAGEAVIESVAPRRNWFRRAAFHRVKSLAANVTRVALVTAVEPSFSDELLARALAAAAAEAIPVLILLNKIDLPNVPAARARLAPLAALGYPVIEIAATRDIDALRDALRPWLAGERTVLVGQSGMGKSTLVNALVPEANAATNEISHFLASGRHTTTAARLYHLDATSALIDSPGMQEFGLAHLDRATIEAGFVELRPYLGHCRFADCRHDAEPGCAVKGAVAAGAIDARRFELYRRICS